jgi:hypothetical protein
MSGKYRKAMLEVGTYTSPDGEVVVTPERLRHWEKEVRRVQEANYVIPMHWDHASDMELLEPIMLDTLHENKTRSAKNTVGKIVDFQVAADGQAANITLETLTPEATRAAASNTCFVSPVLFSEWRDGRGNLYRDVIGSVDFVDYPVDASQGPFEPVQDQPQFMSCVIRMATNPRIFRMASEKDPSSAEPFGSEPAADATSYPVAEGSDDAITTDTTPPQAGGTSVSDVLEALAQLGLVLPADTTTTSFLERLRPALLTAIAGKQQPEVEQPATTLPPEENQQQPDNPIMSEQPQIAAMSALKKRIETLESDRIEATRVKLKERIQTLLTSGRCFPHEANDKSRLLQVQKLSVAADCTVHSGDLDVWLRSREVLPTGACWDATQKVSKLGTKPVEAPQSYDTKGSISKREEDEAVAALTARNK